MLLHTGHCSMELFTLLSLILWMALFSECHRELGRTRESYGESSLLSPAVLVLLCGPPAFSSRSSHMLTETPFSETIRILLPYCMVRLSGNWVTTHSRSIPRCWLLLARCSMPFSDQLLFQPVFSKYENSRNWNLRKQYARDTTVNVSK